MKSNITVEFDEDQMVNLMIGNDVLIEIETFAKENDNRGGLFRKLIIDVICRKIETIHK